MVLLYQQHQSFVGGDCKCVVVIVEYVHQPFCRSSRKSKDNPRNQKEEMEEESVREKVFHLASLLRNVDHELYKKKIEEMFVNLEKAKTIHMWLFSFNFLLTKPWFMGIVLSSEVVRLRSRMLDLGGDGIGFAYIAPHSPFSIWFNELHVYGLESSGHPLMHQDTWISIRTPLERGISGIYPHDDDMVIDDNEDDL